MCAIMSQPLLTVRRLEIASEMHHRETIAALYRSGAWGHGDTFERDLDAHRKHGYIIDTPECFIMWRTVWPLWSLEEMRTPELVYPKGHTAWVWAAAGDIKAAADAALQVTPDVRFVGYDRRGKTRFWHLNDVLYRIR